jgi:hypothetical protein
MGTLFDEMDQIVQDQLHVDDLGYSDSEGTISGDDVVRDVIQQGSQIAAERRQMEQQLGEKKLVDKTPDEQVITTTYFW